MFDKQCVNGNFFEFDDDGYLVVDCAFYVPQFSNFYVVEIDGKFYKLPCRLWVKDGYEIAGKLQCLPYFRKNFYNLNVFEDYAYRLRHLVRRCGYEINVGRAITSAELNDFMLRHSLVDMTDEFVDTRGGFYGKRFVVSFVCVQLVVSADLGIKLENELLSQGIEARNSCVGRLNVRVR